MKRVFSGIQPTGVPHLGNYLGAIRGWVEMQKGRKAADSRSNLLFSIVDLHAMTVPYNAEELRLQSVRTAATLLACGLEPENCVLFRQSDVVEHSELAWILGCVTPLGWLQRMTQFKEKAQSLKGDRKKGRQESKLEVSREMHTDSGASLGLLSYPVLQAADVLLYQTDQVPVGEDQTQHIELARDIARLFNHQFQSDVFTIPSIVLPPTTARIMSLKQATKKMSKSDPNPDNRIDLTDTPDDIRRKIRKAKTDSLPHMTYEPTDRPERANLLTLYSALSPSHPTPASVASEFATSSTLDFKNALADLIVDHICPIGDRLQHLLQNDHIVHQTLHDGAKQATTQAQQTMQQVRKATGIGHHQF